MVESNDGTRLDNCSHFLSRTAVKALEAYGGRDLWRRAQYIKAVASARGLAFALKWQRPLVRISIKADVVRPRITLTPIDLSGNTGILEEDTVRVEASTGTALRIRKNPRDRFPYGRRLFWWDVLDQIYFTGYAFWNYLTLPFLLMRGDIEWTELAPGKLKAFFPASIPTHCHEQFFIFDLETSLLKQHDYTAEVMGNWAKAANIVLEHGHWNGIPYPSKRRVTPRRKDGTPANGPVLIDIEIHQWSLEE